MHKLRFFKVITDRDWRPSVTLYKDFVLPVEPRIGVSYEIDGEEFQMSGLKYKCAENLWLGNNYKDDFDAKRRSVKADAKYWVKRGWIVESTVEIDL